MTSIAQGYARSVDSFVRTMRRTALPSILFLASGSAMAADTAAAPDAAAGITQMLLGLAVVLALLFAGLHVLKRLSAPRGAAGAVRVVAATAVGPRERVVLLEVADTWLVVGVAPGSVRSLHTLPRQELPAGQPMLPAKDFGGWLRQALERRNGR